MARKKSAATTTVAAPEDTSFNPDEFDPQPTVGALVQDVANNTHLPADMERQASHENGHAASVGRREPVVQSGLVFARNDLLAGVKQGEGFRLIGGRKIREGVIAFSEKPSPDILATMNDAGFKWMPADKLWTHPIRPDSEWQDRAHTEQTFEAVSKQVRTERGIEHSVGVTA